MSIIPNQLKNWQKVILTIGILGILFQVGFLLIDTKTSSFQIEDISSNQSSPSLSKQKAKNIIEQWLEAKSRIFAPPYDHQLLGELTTGERYRKMQGSMEWLQKNNAYYDFGVQKVEEIKRLETSDKKATVTFKYTEDRTLYVNGEMVPKESDFKTRTVLYNLQLTKGEWKIKSAKIYDQK